MSRYKIYYNSEENTELSKLKKDELLQIYNTQYSNLFNIDDLGYTKKNLIRYILGARYLLNRYDELKFDGDIYNREDVFNYKIVSRKAAIAEDVKNNDIGTYEEEFEKNDPYIVHMDYSFYHTWNVDVDNEYITIKSKDGPCNKKFYIKANMSRIIWNVMNNRPFPFYIDFFSSITDEIKNFIKRGYSNNNEDELESIRDYDHRYLLSYFEPTDIDKLVPYKTIRYEYNEGINPEFLDRAQVVFKSNLYRYQDMTVDWMMNLENHKNTQFIWDGITGCGFKSIPTKYGFDKNLKYRTNNNGEIVLSKNNKYDNNHLKIKGGILAAEMGLGKTVMMLKLITSDYDYNDIYQAHNTNGGIMYSPTNIIVVPTHLIDQWGSEIKKHCPSLTFYMVKTAYHINRLIGYSTDLNLFDCIIVTSNTIDRFYTFTHKYKWRRIIMDEFHEYCYDKDDIIYKSLLRMKAEFKWFVSGSPFFDPSHVETITSIMGYKFYKNYIHNNSYRLMNYCYYRITTEFVEKNNQLNLPNTIYHNQILKMMETEMIEYNNEVIKLGDNVNTIKLQKLCCDVILAQLNSAIDSNQILSMEQVKTQMFEKYKQDLVAEEKELVQLNNKLEEIGEITPETPENIKMDVRIIKSGITRRTKNINRLGYVCSQYETLFDKVSIDCGICMDSVSNIRMLECKHYLCIDCHNMWFKVQNKTMCPICRTVIKNISTDTIKLGNEDAADEIKMDDEEIIKQNYIKKHGTKIGTLIYNIKSTDKKALVYSQWDEFLQRIKAVLLYENIKCTFIENNVYVQRKIIRNFSDPSIKPDDDKYIQILLLSTKNTASGLNLPIAKVVHLMDVVNASKNEIRMIEQQAITRSRRIGQTEDVTVYRYIMKNTIEEKLYIDTYEDV